MNRKAQAGPVGMIIVDVFFIIFMALGGAAFVNTATSGAIASANITGLDAFLLANMNVWIFLAMIVGNVLYFTFGGSQ